jgi:lipoate---protein ligase
MIFVENPSSDPWFNIAAEEYFLKNYQAEIVMLWSSSPSIIVGKHQNTLAEVNLPFILKNNIPVIRRLSGGGTVFHDPGNFNFTFIRNVETEKMVDFRAHTLPVIEFLKSLNVDARFEGKNDLRVNGLKISGNAEHIYKKKVLHHGTLLFDADLDHLKQALNSREIHFESKAIKSIRSNVTNISSILNQSITRIDFHNLFRKFLVEWFPVSEIYSLNEEDIRQIEKLKKEKYITWEWNFGYSPAYEFTNQATIENYRIDVKLTVKKGLCTGMDVRIDDEAITSGPVISGIQSISHNPQAIDRLLAETNFMNYNHMKDKWQLLGLFF